MNPKTALFLLSIVCSLRAQEPATTVAAAPAAPAALELTGTLVPAEAVEISLWLEEYSGQLLVLEVVPHGAPVNQGDILVRLDTSAIDEQIRHAELQLMQQEQKAQQTEAEARIQSENGQAAIDRAERELDWAQRRLRGFLEQEKEHKREGERLQSQAEDSRLEDQRDELTQLEKMYKEDELVDATEEIVLKRSRRGLAQAQASVALQRRVRALKQELDDVIRQEGLEFDVAQKAAALERQRRSAELADAGRKLDHERARRDLDKQRRQLDHLRRDRDLLDVRAQRRGIALHGERRAVPGTGKLEKGSTLQPRKTFLTVAEPDRFEVVTDLPEKDLFRARTGKAAQVVPVALPELELSGAIRVAHLATGRKGEDNLYETVIPLEARDVRLRPGMRCKVSIAVGGEAEK